MKRLQPYFLGDFYPLTPGIFDPAAWGAYQLLDPEKQAGAVLAFRRTESPMTSASFQLQGLEPAATYQFECADSGQTWRVTGSELMMKGLEVVASTPRLSRLLFYKTELKGMKL